MTDRPNAPATLLGYRLAENAGEIERERFWLAATEFHVKLKQYKELLKDSIIDRIEIRDAESRIVTKAGHAYVWFPEDARSSPTIAVNYGAYELTENRLLMIACSEAKVVFDIGANVGWYAVQFAADLKGRNGALHAFEPVPPTFQKLTRNLEINDVAGVTHVNNLGLGDSAGILEMYLPDVSGSGAASLRDLHPDESSVRHQVSIETLDGYCRRNNVSGIDLVKCDVEGAELMVMKGGLDTLKADRPIILLELLRKWSAKFGYHPNDVIGILAELGYECWAWSGDQLVSLDAIRNETIQTNFFFLHPAKHEWFVKASKL